MIGKMEDGLPKSDSSSKLQQSPSVDSFLDSLLRTSQTCTHTHTCNPPGPDTAHVHTCYHTHTHTSVIPPENESPVPKPQRPVGNREAVRKYREKKKAHAAYLEEEVEKLRTVNQQLMKKMKRQAVLEAEFFRLRGVLVDIRGKLDGELGAFPLGKHCDSVGNFEERNCGGKSISVNDLSHLSGSSIREMSIGRCGNVMANLESNCQPAIFDCRPNTNGAGSGGKRLQNSDGSILMQSAVQKANIDKV